MSKETKEMENATETTAVNFDDPAAIEAELAAAGTAAAVAPKERKPAKPRILKIKFTADKDYKAGDEIEFDYEVPKGEGTRGVLSGIALVDMDDDQLKIEYRNANSVYYKAKKANKTPEIIAKNEERLNAVKAEMEKRGIQPTSRAAAELDADTIAKAIMSGKVSAEDIQAILNQAAQV